MFSRRVERRFCGSQDCLSVSVARRVAIDGNLETGVAHLRWFIVDDVLRGTGIGRVLMTRAIHLVDKHFAEAYLSTFKSLDAARHLYESFGFRLCEEAEGTQWGTRVTEQRFVRQTSRLPQPSPHLELERDSLAPMRRRPTCAVDRVLRGA